MVSTGIDLSKILGGQTKILGEKVIKVIIAWAFLNYWGAIARAASPKSTPMMVSATQTGQCNSLWSVQLILVSATHYGQCNSYRSVQLIMVSATHTGQCNS